MHCYRKQSFQKHLFTLFCSALGILSLVSCQNEKVEKTSKPAHEHHPHGHKHEHGHEHPHDHSQHDHEHEHEHDEIIRLNADQLNQAGIYTAAVQQGELRHVIKAPARVILKTDKIAHVIPPISGIVEAAYKQIGDMVQEGEVLALIRSREMAEVKSQYLAALKLETLNHALFQKERSLYERKISTEQEFLKSEHEAVAAAIQSELARQRLYALGLSQAEIEMLPQAHPEELARYVLRAPIDGTVVERDMTQGEYVDGTHETFQIADLSDLWMEITLYSSDLARVRPGHPITAVTPHGQSIETQVAFVKPLLNEDTRLAQAIASIDNSQGDWLPGTFVTALIEANRTAYPLIVPKASVQQMDGLPSVFVETEEGFEIRPVRLGAEDEECFEVIGGLAEGEVIALGNTFLLKAEHEKDEAAHEH